MLASEVAPGVTPTRGSIPQRGGGGLGNSGKYATSKFHHSIANVIAQGNTFAYQYVLRPKTFRLARSVGLEGK